MSTKKIKKPKIRPLSRRKILAYANNGVMKWHGLHTWDNISLRTKIYGFICIIAVFAFVIFPVVSSAALDIFGYGVHDIYVDITKNVDEANNILDSGFNFAQTSPYDIVNGITGVQRTRLIAIRNAVTAMSLVVATLLLMVEFFRKTISFEWSSKWENLLIFLIKIIVIKQVVQNADVIIGHVYAGFNSINTAALGGSTSLLPDGSRVTYTMLKANFLERIGNTLGNFVWQFWGFQDFYGDTFSYEVSRDAVRMFYPTATFPPAGNINVDSILAPTTGATFNPTLELALMQPYFLIMKAVAVIVFVIIIGRVFELTLYTLFAPLPIATFASDITNDVGKNFIKNYIAVVLQIAVIVVMFMVFVGMQTYFANAANGYGSTIPGVGFVQTKLIQMVVLITLGLGVVKSGSWAKKICGLA